jgi:hypothetical protein
VIGEASLPLTMLTPAIAVGIMLAVVSPEGGIRGVAASLGLTSAGAKGWPLAIGGPALIHLAGLCVLVASGLAVLAPPEVSGSTAGVALKIAVGLFIGTAFALGEEVGCPSSGFSGHLG